MVYDKKVICYKAGDAREVKKKPRIEVENAVHINTSDIDFTEDVFVDKLRTLIPDLNAITFLCLSHCNLQEFMVPLMLPHLKSLYISHNQLKVVPQCLYDYLEYLEEFDISNNPLKHFKQEPLCVKTLTFLNLSQCRLNSFPHWLLKGKCTNLKTLLINFNDLAEVKETDISLKLNRLEVRNCNMTNKNDDTLKKIAHIKLLDFGNEKNTKLINGIYQLDSLLNKPLWGPSINILKLTSLGFSDLPKTIKNLFNLNELHIDHNFLSSIPSEIGNLKHLKVINVAHNKLYALPSEFSELVNLVRLNAEYNSIGFVNIKPLVNLQYIDLYCNELEAIDIPENVQMVDVDNNYIINFDQVCSNYEQKKNLLRSESNVSQTRINGNKPDVYMDDASSKSDYCEENDEEYVSCETDMDDCWDDKMDSFEISESDNEYQGENTIVVNRNNLKLLYSIDDSVYIDAD